MNRFPVALATIEFSRGFQPTVGVGDLFPVASATIESRPARWLSSRLQYPLKRQRVFLRSCNSTPG